MGAAVNFIVVVTANVKLLLSMNSHTRPALSCKGVVDFCLSLGGGVAIAVCVLSWFWCTSLFSGFYSSDSPPASEGAGMLPLIHDARFLGVFPRLVSSAHFWLAVPLVPLAALIPDIVSKAYMRTYEPETLHLLQELSANEASQDRKVAPASVSAATTPHDSCSAPSSPKDGHAGEIAGEIAAEVAGDPRARYLRATIAERLKSELEGREQREHPEGRDANLGSKDVTMHQFTCAFASDPQLEPYLLLTTHYLPLLTTATPATCHLLLATYYLLLTTCYILGASSPPSRSSSVTSATSSTRWACGRHMP